MSIKVFLADDHQLLVEGFRLTLKNYQIHVVEVAYSLDDLPRRFAESHADVLVIDVRFQGADGQTGLDVCETILAKGKNTKIVVFSQFDDQWIIEKTYKLGVLAFVRKDENTDVLVEAIKTAHSGKEFFSPVVAQLLAWVSVKAPSPARLLDAKELKVFTLIADGLSVSDAAEAMNLSYKTVSNVVKSVKQKLNIESFADFTKLAIKFGLTNLDVRTKT
ncbi:MAG: response regulator transcription factor [Leptolyngbya sp.]|nr:response regulator transcription factor [Candidatus Melainabacteria bacterium]